MTYVTQDVESKPFVLSDYLHVRFESFLDGIATFLNGLGLMPNTITLIGLVGNAGAAVLLAFRSFILARR